MDNLSGSKTLGSPAPFFRSLTNPTGGAMDFSSMIPGKLAPSSPLAGGLPPSLLPFYPMYPNMMYLNNGYLQNLYALAEFQSRMESYLNQHRTPVKPICPSLFQPLNLTETPKISVKSQDLVKKEAERFKSSPNSPLASPGSTLLPPRSPTESPLISPGAKSTFSQTSSKGSAGSSFQDGVTVGYTFDALFVSDGRSKRRTHPPTPKDQQRYLCSQCGKSYATSSNLSRHKQTHRPLDSNYAKPCPECKKVYVSMPALSMHILTHKLEHNCDICGKAFSRPWLLQGHMRSHTGQKPFGCAHCGKAFADRSNLRAHMQTHSGLKRYPCATCGKAFALKSYLNKHVESSCGKDLTASEADLTEANSLCSPMGSDSGDGHNSSRPVSRHLDHVIRDLTPQFIVKSEVNDS